MTYPETLNHYPTLYNILKFITSNPTKKPLFPKMKQSVYNTPLCPLLTILVCLLSSIFYTLSDMLNQLVSREVGNDNYK